MIKFALKGGEAGAAPDEPMLQDEHIAPVPRISIQAFCTSSDTAGTMQQAGEDRRMTKAHLKIQMGGITAATSSAGRAAIHLSPRTRAFTRAWMVRGFSSMKPRGA